MAKSRAMSTFHDLTNDVSVPASVPAWFFIAAGQHSIRATNSMNLLPPDIATSRQQDSYRRPFHSPLLSFNSSPSLFTALHSTNCKFL
jgi:hypothetical protein